ncbi:hypothetical protein [Oleiharenicola lentus]|uniref:hypothetical protein n=1 Tax=Oleiharenicola lentus TaxID=2508720 RepID=UPI003F667F51
MKSVVNKNTLLTVLAVASALGSCVWVYRLLPSSPQITVSPTAVPGETLTVSKEEVEIFRRAFWWHPSKGDKILHAERREWSEANASVTRWQWFIKIRPSSELLRDLRRAETFGLTEVDKPKPWSQVAPLPLPTWFPQAPDTPFEILQTASGEFTVLYRPSDNTLYATDHGRGFAPAAPR